MIDKFTERIRIDHLTEIPDYGVSNAMFSNTFGYLWMLYQVH